jgi:hypothetical protein
MLEGALAHIATELGLDPEKASEDEVVKPFDDRLADLGEEEDEVGEAGAALSQLRTLTGKATAREAMSIRSRARSPASPTRWTPSAPSPRRRTRR